MTDLPKTLILSITLITILASPGCLRRRMTVRTSPPGAMVYVDRQPIGVTPVSSSFTYYGTRHFEIVKDGFRTEKFMRRFNPPWYELPGLAFITETLYPFEKRDERIVDVQLSPEAVVPTETIIASGQELRDQSRLGVAVSAPPTASSLGPAVSVSPSDLVLPANPPVNNFPSDTYPNSGFPQTPAVPNNGPLFGFPNRIPSAEPIPGGAYRPLGDN